MASSELPSHPKPRPRYLYGSSFLYGFLGFLGRVNVDIISTDLESLCDGFNDAAVVFLPCQCNYLQICFVALAMTSFNLIFMRKYGLSLKLIDQCRYITCCIGTSELAQPVSYIQ